MQNKKPPWETVLEYLYTTEQLQLPRAPEETELYLSEDSDQLTNDLKLNFQKANKSVRYLYKSGLIKKATSEDHDLVWELTEKGFSVAHERKMLRRQEQREDERTGNQIRVSRAVGYLTLGLLVATVFDSIVEIALQWSAQMLIAIVLLEAALVSTIAILIFKSNLLSPT